VPADAQSIAISARRRNPDLDHGRPSVRDEFAPARDAANFVPGPLCFAAMTQAPRSTPLDPLPSIVDDYRRDGDVGLLFDRLRTFARARTPQAVKEAATPYRDQPEVVIPLYEDIVSRAPSDAQAMVVLANAYWLTGRGPDVVGELATRAIATDGSNRGAWHLWALAESTVRGRVERWQRVVQEFPSDQLARAALADNATSLAHDEHDPLALDLAIATYEGLLAESTQTAQRMALEQTIQTLRAWTL